MKAYIICDVYGTFINTVNNKQSAIRVCNQQSRNAVVKTAKTGKIVYKNCD